MRIDCRSSKYIMRDVGLWLSGRIGAFGGHWIHCYDGAVKRRRPCWRKVACFPTKEQAGRERERESNQMWWRCSLYFLWLNSTRLDSTKHITWWERRRTGRHRLSSTIAIWTHAHSESRVSFVPLFVAINNSTTIITTTIVVVVVVVVLCPRCERVCEWVSEPTNQSIRPTLFGYVL